MTTTPLPPHVISTDHPNHPSESWSIAEIVWIDARDKVFQAYAQQARADLEAENQRLREALKAILDEQDANQGHTTLETYDAARTALESKP